MEIDAILKLSDYFPELFSHVLRVKRPRFMRKVRTFYTSAEAALPGLHAARIGIDRHRSDLPDFP